MMTGIKWVWLALSRDAVPVCCGRGNWSNGDHTGDMPIALFRDIAELVRQNGLACRVITSRRALSAPHMAVCRQMNAEFIVPNTHEGDLGGVSTTVVMDQENGASPDARLCPSHVIVRVKKAVLGSLAGMVCAILEQVPDVSLRHPDLPGYSDEDLQIYQEQLEEIGRWLVAQGTHWRSLRIDCLTDGITTKDIGECGAGNSHLAIGSDGQVSICPGFFGSGQDLGPILGETHIPDRHLLSRAYSLLCKTCTVDHCLRCVYHNKTSTREYCVSAANVCRLAHIEQRARVALAREAKGRGSWSAAWNDPVAPTICDPFEPIEADRRGIGGALWQQPCLAMGDPEALYPGAMLEVIHELHGIVRAVHLCVQAGAGISSIQFPENTPLTRARARTVEACRDVRFGPECPTMREIERVLMKRIEKEQNRANP
jgi:CXXX repeat peptide maturase